MEALKNKLKSRRGASILLAMLFLLVCMFVGASILMAAGSNVGKYDSNKEEQQKYLTVSSALNMLIAELEKVEYEGRYTYTHTEVDEEPESGTPGDSTYDPGHPAYDVYTYEQESIVRVSGSAWLDTVLPLSENLEYIFAETIDNKALDTGCGCDDPDDPDNENHDEHYFYTYTPPGSSPPASSYTLAFSVNDATKKYGTLSDEVEVEVLLRTDGSIRLTATLKDDAGKADYTMGAELRPVPDKWLRTRLALSDAPDDEHKVSGAATDDIYKTDSVQWKLEYIFKKEVDPDET